LFIYHFENPGWSSHQTALEAIFLNGAMLTIKITQ